MDVQGRCSTRAYKRGDGMIKLTVFYTDGTEIEYRCEKVSYDARVIFAKTDSVQRMCIPYANVYVVIEEVAE